MLLETFRLEKLVVIFSLDILINCIRKKYARKFEFLKKIIPTKNDKI